MLFLVLVIGAVIWVVMMLVHERDHRHAPPGTNAGPGRQSDAQRILDERFANGTIDIEDYKARRELLRHPPE